MTVAMISGIITNHLKTEQVKIRYNSDNLVFQMFAIAIPNVLKSSDNKETVRIRTFSVHNLNGLLDHMINWTIQILDPKIWFMTQLSIFGLNLK